MIIEKNEEQINQIKEHTEESLESSKEAGEAL